MYTFWLQSLPLGNTYYFNHTTSNSPYRKHEHPHIVVTTTEVATSLFSISPYSTEWTTLNQKERGKDNKYKHQCNWEKNCMTEVYAHVSYWISRGLPVEAGYCRFRQSCPRIPRYSSFPSSPLLQLYGIKNRNCIQNERSYEDKQIIKTDHRSQSRTTIQLSSKDQRKKMLELFLIYCDEVLQVITQNIWATTKCHKAMKYQVVANIGCEKSFDN